MPKKAAPKSALAVSRLKESGLHFVGTVDGLALQITATGARSWVLRATIGDKRREMGLGGFPSVTLAEAHEAARRARAQIRQGLNPIHEKKVLKSAQLAALAAERTFNACANEYIAAHESGWRNAKHAQQWRNTLEKYAYPVLGEMLIRDVDTPAILKVIEPIWKEKTETATRLQQRINLVIDMAIAREYRAGPNPARWRGYLDKMLVRPSKIMAREHHPAVSVAEVGVFMNALRAQKGVGAKALEFAVLTAARSGEVRGATWSEIDVSEKVWTIPGPRMKSGKEHRVPLSPAAMKVIEALPRSSDDDHVFASPKGGRLSDMSLSSVMKRMKLDAVPHGFRSTFRDWCSEKTAYPRELAEMALAHAVGNQVEQSYAHSILLEKRRTMMNDWANFCGKVPGKGDVVPIRRQGRIT